MFIRCKLVLEIREELMRIALNIGCRKPAKSRVLRTATVDGIVQSVDSAASSATRKTGLVAVIPVFLHERLKRTRGTVTDGLFTNTVDRSEIGVQRRKMQQALQQTPTIAVIPRIIEAFRIRMFEIIWPSCVAVTANDRVLRHALASTSTTRVPATGAYKGWYRAQL